MNSGLLKKPVIREVHYKVIATQTFYAQEKISELFHLYCYNRISPHERFHNGIPFGFF